MKKKISQFEFAIRKVAEPETIDNYEPLTDEEVLKARDDKRNNFYERANIETMDVNGVKIPQQK